MSLVEKAVAKMKPVAGSGKTPLPPAAALSASPAQAVKQQTSPVPRESVQVSRPALRASGLLAPESEDHRVAAEFRQIKRPLLAKAFGRGGAEIIKDGHVLMVCSAIQGDGKTFTSVNLAMSLAMESDSTTLLVDADVLKPNITRVFGLENKPGLLDILQDGSVPVESVIYSTDVPGLMVLPAGSSPAPNATELFAGASMKRVIELLGSREHGRVIVFDTSPLLLTSEAQALSANVGQIVLVVRAGVTPQQVVKEAIEVLGSVGKISLVLNQCVDSGRSDGRYGQYPEQTASV